jgi:hypothetical protein
MIRTGNIFEKERSRDRKMCTANGRCEERQYTLRAATDPGKLVQNTQKQGRGATLVTRPHSALLFIGLNIYFAFCCDIK